MNSMDHFRDILMLRLEQKGMTQPLIPGLLRVLSVFFMQNPNMNLAELNTRLEYIGWNDFEIDYHTFQMAIAYFGERHDVRFKNYQAIN